MCMVLKKMCMMCMILSPNCCAATISEYSSADVTEVYSKVKSEPKHQVATTGREFKFIKRMAFSVLGSLITAPLHSK